MYVISIQERFLTVDGHYDNYNDNNNDSSHCNNDNVCNTLLLAKISKGFGSMVSGVYRTAEGCK